MKKTSFKNKVAFKARKAAISLKRNFYVVPLILVLITALQFLCVLFILSPMFYRVSQALTPWGAFNCVFVFLITLFCILYSVSYLNYAMKKYGSKRPIHMLIIYYVLWALNIVMLILIYISNNAEIADELAILNSNVAESEKIIAKQYYELGLQSKSAILWQLILAGVSFVVVSIAPLIQARLKKVSFKKINEDGQEEAN